MKHDRDSKLLTFVFFCAQNEKNRIQMMIATDRLCVLAQRKRTMYVQVVSAIGQTHATHRSEINSQNEMREFDKFSSGIDDLE